MSTAQSDGGKPLGEMPSDKPELYQVESWCLLASMLKCPIFSRVSHAHQASRNIGLCCETLVRLRPLGTGALLLKILWGKTYLQWSHRLGMTRFPRGKFLQNFTGFAGQPFRRCSSFLLVPVINSMTKCKLGSEGFDWITQSSQSILQGSQRRNSSKNRGWKHRAMLLAGLPFMVQSAWFLYDHSGLPRSHIAHSGLGLSTSLINQ